MSQINGSLIKFTQTMKINKFLLLFLLLKLTYAVHAQDPTGSISVVGGSSVNFIVNSLKKYDEGVVLEGWSRIRLQFDDPAPVTTLGWQLNLKAETLTIVSDSGTPDLDLSTLEIRAISVDVLSGSYTGTAVPQTIVLNSGYVELLTDTQTSNVDLIITISYDLGTQVANKLMGSEPGSYFVDLRFQLVSLE